MALKITSSLWTSYLIAFILMVAAVLKWVSPAAQNPYFYFIVGGIEALMALSLIAYHRSWRIWALLMLILALWLGFSFYTTLFGLSCSCLGAALDPPRGMTFIINGLMLLAAWNVLSHHAAHPIKLKRISWFLIIFFIFGFLSSIVYYNLNN